MRVRAHHGTHGPGAYEGQTSGGCFTPNMLQAACNHYLEQLSSGWTLELTATKEGAAKKRAATPMERVDKIISIRERTS